MHERRRIRALASVADKRERRGRFSPNCGGHPPLRKQYRCGPMLSVKPMATKVCPAPINQPGNVAFITTSYPIMRRRLSWTRVLAILALVAGAFAYAMLPGSSTFTVGTQTTYVTGPLDKHGYVDYVTALNERLRNGIAPEDNANVLIWQALGPRPTGDDTIPPGYLQWVGGEAPP